MTERARRSTIAVFLTLLCLYALTAGGQGYSVDGTFSFQLARSVATDPTHDFARRNAATLARWGPVLPALGVPFVWLGAALGRLAPPRDSVAVDGERLTLYDFPPIGGPASGAPGRLELPVTGGALDDVQRARVVSFLSLASSVADGAPVASLVLVGRDGAPLARVVLRAGRETAEWAYDVPGAAPSAHARARVVGRWPGNPQANLYGADLDVGRAAQPAAVVVEWTGADPTARLHLRAVQLRGARGAVEVVGPTSGTWMADDQAAFFARFAFSFVNVPLVALTCALLVPLGAFLGYSTPAATALALATGVATPLWPYAKHDFAEPAAALFIVAATLCVVGARGAARRFVLGGACAALAAGARYTAAWLLPVLAVQAAYAGWQTGAPVAPIPTRLRRAATACGLTVLVPALGLVALLASGRRLPTIWGGAGSGLAQSWLDFSPLNGLYGLTFGPGKGLLWYAPGLVLALAGAPAFLRRQRAHALVFAALPALYLLTYGSKGVWHGGGWGPRYLIPIVPLVACLALPVVERLIHRRSGVGASLTAALLVISVAAQLLGALKHPNLYTVMYRDHVAPKPPSYGYALGGPPAEGYWRHFGGPAAARQLTRPTRGVDPSLPARGLGYAFAESGPLSLTLDAREPFTLSVYVCDWDHRGRRERLRVEQPGSATAPDLDGDLSQCLYRSTPVAAPGPVRVVVDETTGSDVPVLSALFFDRSAPPLPAAGDGAWEGRVGRDGYVLFAWDRGADVASLPRYVSGPTGGGRVWVDTWQTELIETALLYAPGFSPLLAHAWLLGSDAIAALRPADTALLQRAVASPPWRYVYGLEIHSPNPEYALGLDLWPILLRSHFRSHPPVMAAAWLATSLLALGLIAG
ncbi:MAG TPA: hypothetical protein VFX49_18210, partial [Chloroflexota bacterium]|nr:hypothetical protein [Chloroflexota bacterium]